MKACNLHLSLAICLVVWTIEAGLAQPVYTGFRPGELWYDTDGNLINAHGGGILFHQGVYYWFGEYRYGKDRSSQQRSSPGVSCYSSTDLYNWTFKGIVMRTMEKQGHDIERGAIVERPKVIYNEQTNQFVMWFHLELKGQGYRPARAAVAVASSPTGPFEFIESKRPLAGHWPRGFSKQQRQSVPGEDSLEWWTPQWWEAVENGLFVRRDFHGGQMSRDQTIFVDKDGIAYQIAASEENLTMHIRKLTADYLDFAGDWIQIFPGGHNEAPAIFENEGNYYLLASGCTGWKPNAARSFTAKSLWGPWEALGNPAKGINPNNGIGPEKTFGAQSTYIFPVQDKSGAYIAMFDMWRPRNQIDSRYIWLPVTIEDGRFIVKWLNEWDLSYFD